MSHSHVRVTDDGHWIEIIAEGGTRRQRGSAIAAVSRTLVDVTLYHLSRSETYGFQSQTIARYVRGK